jgi:hypothetical protein
VGQLDEEWHANSFHGGKWKISMGAKILARGYKIGTLYMTNSQKGKQIVEVELDEHRSLIHCIEKSPIL